MLSAMTTEAITRWETSLPAREGISRRTAADARSLLGTILGDAAAHKPPLIPYNPALRPRNRGRKTGRRLARSPQRAWATPLQALFLAERAALLIGRDDDFTLIVTLAYTGLRWGEVIGLEHGYLHPKRDPGRMADPRGRRQVLPDPAEGRLLPQPRLGALPPGRPPVVPGRPARPASRRQLPKAVRMHRGARRQRPVPIPLPRRQASPAEQLRPPGVPARLRRTS